jgi:hypothetical protein
MRDIFIGDRQVLLATVLSASTVILAVLLALYGDVIWFAAIIDSIVFTIIVTAFALAARFAMSAVRAWQAQLTVGLLILAVAVGADFSLLYLFGLEDENVFIRAIPLRILVVGTGYIVFSLWLENDTLRRQNKVTLCSDKVPNCRDKVPNCSDKELHCSGTPEHIDRISVKDGDRIHIVPVEEILYVQAAGDYATLFTPSGQYVKEQTMKYLEMQLPPTFVRIHRSTIVNAEHILRIERFGKETYSVRLKNGTSLRASSTGYKLLRDRIGL